MILTFHTPSRANIIYDQKIGIALLKFMGRTGNVPGAVDAEHVPDALARLRENLDMHDDSEEEREQHESDDDYVAMRIRAFPLIEFLEAAVAEDDYVSWE